MQDFNMVLREQQKKIAGLELALEARERLLARSESEVVRLKDKLTVYNLNITALTQAVCDIRDMLKLEHEKYNA